MKLVLFKNESRVKFLFIDYIYRIWKRGEEEGGARWSGGNLNSSLAARKEIKRAAQCVCVCVLRQ